MKTEYFQIDGSSMEGGGQILRNSISLSAMLNKPVRIVNIRAGREKPGLQAQHLCGILLVRDMFRATLTGGKVQSTEILFSSNKGFNPTTRSFIADTQTAGSIGLLIQIALPCITFAPEPVTLTLRGGTNASHAPQIDYTTMVFQPMVAKMGVKFDLDIKKRGFYPKGGGLVELKSSPVTELQPINLTERGKVIHIKSRSFASGIVPVEVAERISKTAVLKVADFLKDDQSVKYEIDSIKETNETAFGEGAGIIMVATTDKGCIIAGSALGERGKKAEVVGEEAAQDLINNLKHGGCVDEYLQDQLIIFMALAKGTSKLLSGPLSLHTKTTLHFTEHLSGAKFTVTQTKNPSTNEENNLIECVGIGFSGIKSS